MKSRKKNRSKPLGQSLVEFTLMLPILLIIISGLVEFGFLLNFYLDLVDTSREVARNASDDDPVHDETGAFDDDPLNDPEPNGFYSRAYDAMSYELTKARQISLDQGNNDDMVLSIFTIKDGAIFARYPGSYNLICDQGGEKGWRLYCNQESRFDNARVQDMLNELTLDAPNTGIVLVEIFYNYNLVMGLPWVEAFIGNPVTLHAYSIMPNRSAAP
jgi:hypothetical protein